MSTKSRILSWVLLLTVAIPAAARSQSSPQSAPPDTSAPAPPPQKIPLIDGGSGPCSLDLTVTTADAKPVAEATVKVHIAYGFGGFRKLDLEAGTNVEGKVRFAGLPSRVRRPPLEFHGSKEQLAGDITYNPETECQSKRVIILQNPNSNSAQH